MGYYKVLAGYYIQFGNLKYDYWLDSNFTDMDILGFKIYLLDKYNKIQCLILKRNVVQEFYKRETKLLNSINNSPSVVSSYSYFDTIKSNVVANYSIRESDKTELQTPRSNKLKPIGKNKDIIFILEGGDINNHLFSINKYGNNDEYNYSGSFRVYIDNWVLYDGLL